MWSPLSTTASCCCAELAIFSARLRHTITLSASRTGGCIPSATSSPSSCRTEQKSILTPGKCTQVRAGRALPCQGKGRGFDPLLSLLSITCTKMQACPHDRSSATTISAASSISSATAWKRSGCWHTPKKEIVSPNPLLHQPLAVTQLNKRMHRPHAGQAVHAVCSWCLAVGYFLACQKEAAGRAEHMMRPAQCRPSCTDAVRHHPSAF